MAHPRLKMRLALAEQALQGAWACRPVCEDDAPALARLMLDAYRGTIDDEGETLDDALAAMQETFAGAYGPLLPLCSFLIEEWGEPLACTLVTCWQGQPLLAFVMTHPVLKNYGVGRFLIQKSINALLAHRYQELSLFVTSGNLPAQRLYERLGFQTMSTSGFAEINGTTLYYEVAGEGQPLVFLHSGLTHSQMWDAQWETFARHYRVIRYDTRGFGRSGAASGTFSYRDDLYQLLRLLDVERAYLVGSSMGGSVALDFALEHPEMVAALVLVGSGVSGKQPSDFLLERWKAIDAVAEGGDLAQAVELELQLWVDGPGRAPGTVDASVREQVRQMNTHNFERAQQEQGEPASLEPPAIARLGEIHVPTLALVGEQDVPEELTSAELLERGIPGAKKIVMPGVAHLPSMEQPEAFNRLVLDFLASL
jgi:pimeloyl-ACP methyl ester carboxylesterase